MQSDVKGIVKGARESFPQQLRQWEGCYSRETSEWSANDTNLILVPSTDGMSLEVSTVANDPGTSFYLVLAGTIRRECQSVPLSMFLDRHSRTASDRL